MSNELVEILQKRRGSSRTESGANASQQDLAAEQSGNIYVEPAIDDSTDSSEESSVVSSSDESSAESDDQPAASHSSHPQELRSRLATFLPLMREANQSLNCSAGVGFEVQETSDDDEETPKEERSPGTRQLIEMNLDLGVLEQCEIGRGRDVVLQKGNLEHPDDSQRDSSDLDAMVASKPSAADHRSDPKLSSSPKRRPRVEIVEDNP